MIAKLKTLRRIVISSSVGLCCVVTTESDTHYPLSAHSGSNLTIQILKSISPLPPLLCWGLYMKYKIQYTYKIH